MPMTNPNAADPSRPVHRGLKIEWQDVSGAIMLRLRGPMVTESDAETLQHVVRHVLSVTAEQSLVFDMAGAAPITARGMTALILAQGAVRRAGRHLVLLKPSVPLRTMIDQLELSGWDDVAETEASAIQRARDWRSDGVAPQS